MHQSKSASFALAQTIDWFNDSATSWALSPPEIHATST
jgi:hypothetical protein